MASETELAETLQRRTNCGQEEKKEGDQEKGRQENDQEARQEKEITQVRR